jgi:pimeloyl-ACP methyl ester carboxylesterase
MHSHDDYLGLDGVQLRYRDVGAGPEVVFIHGWTLDLDSWDPQAEALAGDFRVLRYDRRGFGLSEGEPGLAADIEDLGRLLDRLRLARPALVGMSQGARVALAFALRHPERISGLVLDGPPDELGPDQGTGEGDFSLEGYRRLVRERGIEAFRDDWRAHPLMRLHQADAAARALVDRMLARYPARDLQVPAAAAPPRVDAGAVARLALPVLVVNGGLDTAARRRAGEALARALPLAERVVLARAGHLPNLDDASAYNEALRSFLRRQSRAAA